MLGSTLVLSIAVVIAAWSWGASPQSLAHVLEWTAQALPQDDEGQPTLHLEGVSGNLRQGGRIERLRWQQNGLQIEIEDLNVAWSERLWWDVLWHRQLNMERLVASRVQILDARPESPSQRLQPPAHLTLPWLQRVRLSAELQVLEWAGNTPVQTGQLQFAYSYGPGTGGVSEHHATLQADLRAHGLYHLEARLGATAPLALNLQLKGQVQATVPGQQSPLALSTQLQVQGELVAPVSGEAELQVQARLTALQAPAAGVAPHLDARLTLRPWAALPLHNGELALAQLDLAALWPGAPRTLLSGTWRAGATRTHSASSTGLSEALHHAEWQLQGTLRNDRPGPWDRGSLPLEQLQADLLWQHPTWTLRTLTARLASGTLQASGLVPWAQGQPGAWQGRLSLRNLAPQQLLSTLPLPALDADLQASAVGSGTHAASSFQLSLGPAAGAGVSAVVGRRLLPAPRLQAAGVWQAPKLTLSQLQLETLGAKVSASGIALPKHRQWEGTVQAQAPGLMLHIDGSWGMATDRPSQADLQLTDLGQLQNWLQSSLDRLQGQLPEAGTALLTSIQDKRWQGQASLSAEWAGLGPWRLSAQAKAVSMESHKSAQAVQWHLDHLALRADGPGLNTPRATLQALQMQVHSAQYPLGVRAELLQATDLGQVADRHWTLGAGRLELQAVAIAGTPLPPMTQDPAMLVWGPGHWLDGRLQTAGHVQGLALSWVNAWLANKDTPEGPLQRAGMMGELGFDGQWTLDLPLLATSKPSAPAQAQFALVHRHGDLTLLSGDGPRMERLSAGLREARVSLQLIDERLSGQLRWRSDRAGDADANWATNLLGPQAERPGWQWAPTSPLEGRLQANLPQIGLWSRLAPPGWRMSGRLQVNATLGGTRAQPDWGGELHASDLTLRSLLDGLDFSDGQLNARLAGETLTIEHMQLRGAGGETGGLLSGQGRASWAHPPGQPGAARQATIHLQLQARQLRLLARADRRLTLSGQMEARLRGAQLALEGQLSADQALLLLPDESTPKLGSDVVIRGTERPPGFAAGAAVVPQVRLDLDLGQDFRVRGLGIDTYLGGRLQLTSNPSQPTPQLTGEVRTQRGSYRAYGQALAIEQGRIRFNGPLDNPSLDVLALRPLPTQRVGVAITGTAQSPRVRLYAEPDLPDSEKLAWLVLGRPASGAGAEAAVLQQAALALLSGRGSTQSDSVTRALGLDELSFQGESKLADGSTSAATITLGKRLSSQLYVSYQRSLVGAMGTVAVFYDVSRFLSLRAQAGDDNAIDLIFSHRFDGQAMPDRTITPASP